MAEIDMQGVLESYEDEFSIMLEAAVNTVLPGVAVDRSRLFEAFRDAMQSRYKRWMPVPDEYVDRD